MVIIGIDPDTKLCGVSVMNGGSVELSLLGLFPTCALISRIMPDMVCISAGWLNNIVNFQDRNSSSKVRERISERIGANHEIGKQIKQYCDDNNIPTTLVRPAGKKVNGSQFARLTGITKSNQETRDAHMTILAFLKKVVNP